MVSIITRPIKIVEYVVFVPRRHILFFPEKARCGAILSFCSKIWEINGEKCEKSANFGEILAKFHKKEGILLKKGIGYFPGGPLPAKLETAYFDVLIV